MHSAATLSIPPASFAASISFAQMVAGESTLCSIVVISYSYTCPCKPSLQSRMLSPGRITSAKQSALAGCGIPAKKKESYGQDIIAS
jgi:hypothetical protein